MAGDERLAEIVFTEGSLAAFCEEYSEPELRKYKDFRYERVLESLRQGTRHHLNGSFSDMQFSDRDDNMWFISFDCTDHQKSDDMYDMFVEEVKDNILPQLRAVKDVQASSWKTFKQNIYTFYEFVNKSFLLLNKLFVVSCYCYK